MSKERVYTQFVEIDPNAKTRVWLVVNPFNGDRVCGVIKYHGGFRKYAFFPSDGFRFDAGCLHTIAAFMEEHKNDRI